MTGVWDEDGLFVVFLPAVLINTYTVMRILHLVLDLAVAGLLASCGGKESGYVIEGTVDGLSDGMVYMKQYTDKEFMDADSAEVVDGHFIFRGVCREPMAYGLTTKKDDRRPAVFFLANERMEVTLDETSGSISVTGSEVNDFYFANSGKVGDDGFDMDSLVAANPSSAVCAYFIMKDYSWRCDYAQLKSIRGKLDKSLDGSFYVKQIDAYLARLAALQVGATAPDFTLPDAEGREVSLSSFRGKYVLVDFWAGWCPDCRKANPSLVKLHDKYKDDNFTILGVSLDRSREQWLGAIKKDGLTWTNVSDVKGWHSEVAALYAIRWIPTSYLLDPDGTIVMVSSDVDDIAGKLEELFSR